MKRRNQNSLFLIEIIIAIFIFMCTSAICVQIFVKAHTLNQQANYSTLVLKQWQNISEIWISDTSLSLDDVQTFLKQNIGTYTYYDDSLNISNHITDNYVEILQQDNTLYFNIYYKNELINQLVATRLDIQRKEE